MVTSTAPTVRSETACPACRERIRSVDRFCGACGTACPADDSSGPRARLADMGVRSARLALVAAASLETTLGIVKLVRGGAGRPQARAEAVTALVLGALYAGILVWSRRSPAPAVLVAALLYTTYLLLEVAVLAVSPPRAALSCGAAMLLWIGFFCALGASRGRRRNDFEAP